jgi:hypothetical protein
MRCEYCTRKLGGREISHGIRYGTTDERTDAFIPDRDSAATIICQPCRRDAFKIDLRKAQ